MGLIYLFVGWLVGWLVGWSLIYVRTDDAVFSFI